MSKQKRVAHRKPAAPRKPAAAQASLQKQLEDALHDDTVEMSKPDPNAAHDWEAESTAIYREGGRNGALVAYAGRIVRKLGDGAEAWSVISAWAATHLSPPLDGSEVRAVFDSVLRMQARDPTVSFEKDGLAKDQANAKRLQLKHGDRLRWCPGLKSWLAWDDRRWSTGEDVEGRVESAMLAVVRARCDEANAVVDTSTRKAMFADITDSQRDSRIRASVSAARKFLTVVSTDLDLDGMLLNVENGTLDLWTGELQAHNQGHWITKLAPVAYDPKAKCPEWELFLKLAFAGDADLIAFVRRAVGLTLTGDVTERCFFVCAGPGGTGKTTFNETLRALLGDYGRTVNKQALLRHDNGDRIPDDIARTAGSRLVNVSETDSGDKLASGLVKAFTGNAHISARRLYEGWADFKPTAKIWIDTNHRPRIDGADDAMWSRVRLLPFEVKMEKVVKKVNEHFLRDVLLPELPGILAWAVRGCAEWVADKLGTPKVVAEATADYQLNEDNIGRFIKECCDVKPQLLVAKAAFRAAFLQWYSVNIGKHPPAQATFSKDMTARGFGDKSVRLKGKPTRCWVGLQVRQEG